MMNNDIRLFVYSNMQIEKEKSIMKNFGKGFTCGEVSTGSEKSQYSKIIKPNELEAMQSLFPDTKVVYEGSLSASNYTPIRKTII